MKDYKLKYPTKEAAIADLVAKEVIELDNDKIKYKQGTHAVVFVGVLINTPPVIVDGEITEEATLLDGYHVDILCEAEIEFENEVFPQNPKHRFA